ncbi:phage adaptor protein [Ectopseudomonas khazarica]|uniref:phage adaptor protein n=1 Tax=Ectopseudomonas khazarica TaxID=2502979 RepID=UPI0040338BDB
MAATVGQVLSRAKRVLQEGETGIRWTNVELLEWLNEGYLALLALRPDACAKTAEFVCSPGSRQTLPGTALRLLGVVRNTAAGSAGLAVVMSARAVLDAARRGWHAEPQTLNVEQCIYEPAADPRAFYVYPPASSEARLEIIYCAAPEPHSPAQASDSSAEALRVQEHYAPPLVDYLLFRAYSKDAEHQANMARANMHHGAFVGALGGAVAEVQA